MIDLPHRLGVVAVVFEMLRQGDDIRMNVAKVGVIAVHLNGVGP